MLIICLSFNICDLNMSKLILNSFSCAIKDASSASMLTPAVPILSFKRFAGRKFQQDSRQKRRPPGLKRLDGDYVRRGEVLVSQFYLNFHPGLNVNIDNKNTLTAMREGQVMMTVEKINPNLEHRVAAKYYANMSAPVVYKRFYHVIPFEQTKKFKLVDLV